MKIYEEVVSERVIEKSRFIAHLFAISSEEAFFQRYKELRKHYYDATHCCYGFIGKQSSRHNDDGEPNGTAGLPILSALQQQQVDNIACVVIRYYGGIKLGKGGLYRAYHNATTTALSQATLWEEYPLAHYQVSLDYSSAQRFIQFAQRHAQKVTANYQTQVIIDFYLYPEENLAPYSAIVKGKTIHFLGTENAERKKNSV